MVVVYLGMTVGAYVVLRSMARRWRDGEEDLPSPYGPELVGVRPGARGRGAQPGRRTAGMTLAIAVAAALFIGVVAYAVFGGADFGSGFFDLTAGGDASGSELRTLIDHSIGPVWEANHVWLIYVLVMWWTGFPETFAAAMTTLIVPLFLALLGIVLRGASFAFRKYSATLGQARLFGVDVRGLLADHAVLPRHGRRRDRVRPRAGRGRRRPVGLLAQPDLALRRRDRRRHLLLPGRRLPHRRRRPRGPRGAGRAAAPADARASGW